MLSQVFCWFLVVCFFFLILHASNAILLISVTAGNESCISPSPYTATLAAFLQSKDLKKLLSISSSLPHLELLSHNGSNDF